MTRLVLLFAAVALASCGGPSPAPAPSSTNVSGANKDTGSPVQLLLSVQGVLAFAWADPVTGCQYITTTFVTGNGSAVSTVPRNNKYRSQACGEKL